MNKHFVKTAAALTIAAASIFTACGDDTTAGVTLEDASAIDFIVESDKITAPSEGTVYIGGIGKYNGRSIK